MVWSREEIAKRAALEIQDGDMVNLGIGMPTFVANYLEGRRVFIHSENGLLGMGPFPFDGHEDPQVVNAGKQTVTILPGGSTFDSNMSFAMIRGGHINVAILGAMQVAQNGDLANWAVPGEKIAGMGGAMDLVSGTQRVICLLNHTDKNGRSKLLNRCTLPLTGLQCVNRVITELGVFDVVKDDAEGAFKIVELAPEVTSVEVLGKTDGKLIV